MEGTTDIEAQSTLSTSFLEGFASAVDSVDVARDDELTRAVEVGSDDYPTRGTSSMLRSGNTLICTIWFFHRLSSMMALLIGEM